jgi:hypothetical protein
MMDEVKEQQRQELIRRCDGIINDARGYLHDMHRACNETEAWLAFAVQRHVERQRGKLEEHLP